MSISDLKPLPNLLENEDCLLVNPNLQNPADYLTFKDEVPVPLSGNIAGQKTIDAFQLERLNNSRLEHLLLLKLALIFTEIDPNDDEQINLAMQTFKCTRDEVNERINESRSLYNSAAKDTAKFAHCVRSKFPHLPTV